MYDLVISMADFARNDETFAKIFVEGKAPKDKERKKYNLTSFYPKKETAKIEGSTGTMDVEVSDPEDYSDEPGPIMTWSFAKEGEEWKLDDAPLP